MVASLTAPASRRTWQRHHGVGYGRGTRAQAPAAPPRPASTCLPMPCSTPWIRCLPARPVSAWRLAPPVRGTTTVTIPPATTTGTYYLFAKADGDAAVTETQESNNTTLRSIQVGGDIGITALTMPAEGGGGDVNPGDRHHEEPGRRDRWWLDDPLLPVGEHSTRRIGRLAGRRACRSRTRGRARSARARPLVLIPANVATGAYFVIARPTPTVSSRDAGEQQHHGAQPRDWAGSDGIGDGGALRYRCGSNGNCGRHGGQPGRRRRRRLHDPLLPVQQHLARCVRRRARRQPRPCQRSQRAPPLRARRW